MGDWEQILFERRVLWWTTLLVLVDTGLWLVALATPYWVIHIAGSEEGHLDTDSDSQVVIYRNNSGLVWSHSGIWTKCDLVELYQDTIKSSENEVVSSLRWECWNTIRVQSALIRSELSLAGVAVILTVAATVFSWYSITYPKYTYRRLAAVLHLLTAICVLAVIQLVDGGSRLIMAVQDSRGDVLLHGYSYLLAWCCFLVSITASFLFLLASRKRKLLNSDNVNFTHQKLDINVPSN